MIKMERYKCEYCGTWHDTEEDAKKCEQRHLKPKKIEYIAYNDSVAQYAKIVMAKGFIVLIGKWFVAKSVMEVVKNRRPTKNGYGVPQRNSWQKKYLHGGLMVQILIHSLDYSNGKLTKQKKK